MIRLILLYCLPLLASAATPHVPEIPPAVVAEKAEFSPLEEPADSCPLCTPAERNQLRIKEAERMAKSLNSLVAELEQLMRYPEVSNLLLSEKADGDVLHQINRILGYMRQQQRQVAVSKSAPAVTTVDNTGVAHGRPSLAGLRPVFAQPADLDRGINANVILRSHRDDVILNIGEQLTHNNVRYILYSVRLKDGAPEIVLQDSAGRKQVLPWQ